LGRLSYEETVTQGRIVDPFVSVTIVSLLCLLTSIARADEDGGVGPVLTPTVLLTDASASNDASVRDGGADGGAEAGPDAAVEPALPEAIQLPPVTPGPDIAPIVIGREAVEESKPIANPDRPVAAIKTLLGLLALLALAYLGGHPRVQALERKLGVSQVITAGFPFVVLGLAARAPQVGLLTDALLAEFSPLLRVSLGCIGFVAGFRFAGQFRSAPSADVVRLAVFATFVPFAVVALLSGLVLLAASEGINASALKDPVFIRDAVILGTAGAMTAKTSTEVFRADDAGRILGRILRLEELAGIIGLMVVAAYFRPNVAVTWQLPGTAWLLLTVGLGATLGLVAYFVFRRPLGGPELVALTLGTIGFCAGIAGYLRLSPVVVAFIAGACLAVLPQPNQERIRIALRRLERPIYLLSLIVIGALWQVDDWLGWVLVPVFTFARLLGKWLGTRVGLFHSDLQLVAEERQVLAVSPMGPLAIAIVVNAQLLYPGGSISPIVAAVIGGAVLTEIIVQLVSRRTTLGQDLSQRIAHASDRKGEYEGTP